MTLNVVLYRFAGHMARRPRVVAPRPSNLLAVVVGVAVVVFPRRDAFEPVGEKRRGVFRGTADE